MVRKSLGKGNYIMLAAILLTVLATTPSTPPSCIELQPSAYISEWAKAKKLVRWEGKIAHPHHVIECNYEAYIMMPGGFRRLYGSSQWDRVLDKKGRMKMEERVILYTPGNREQRRVSLIHEFIHILRGRLRHVNDPRARGNDEEVICEIFPDGCNNR